jgi:hypothetical protein
MSSKSFITETPSVDFKVFYGVPTPIVITLGQDLFGFSLRFVVYKDLVSPKILELPTGEDLNFITFEENGKQKTRIFLKISAANSILIPVLKTPLVNLWNDECGIIPTCYYDLLGTIGGEEERVLNGGLQGTLTGAGII